MDIYFLEEYYHQVPIIIKIVWWLIGFTSTFILSLSLFLKCLRTYLRNQAHTIASFKKQYESLLVEYLDIRKGLDNEARQAQILKFQQLTKKKKRRKIFIALLFKLMNELSGDISDSIKDLYYKTHLVDHTVAQLRSNRWHVIAKAIGELTKFQVVEKRQAIMEFTNHPNREVRKEAYLYLVNLFGFGGLAFLNDLVEPLSEWEQIRLLGTLRKMNTQQIDNLQPWLKSSNESVVLFSLKLALIFGRYEVRDTLRELLYHPSKKVRLGTIRTMMELYGQKAKKTLKADFHRLSLEEQQHFTHLLGKFVGPEDELFVQMLLHHENFEIQSLALNILKSMNIEKYQRLKLLPSTVSSTAMLIQNLL